MLRKAAQRVVLVDDAPQGPTARLLESAVSAYNSSTTSSTQRHFETITRQKAQQSIATLDPAGTTVFVSVSEGALSSRGAGPRTPRVACESLAVAQALVRQEVRLPVLLVSQAGLSAFSGIDTAAALLAGMAGLLDDRLVIADGVLQVALRHQHLRSGGRTMLMMGESPGRMRKIREMLEEWELDEESSEIGDLNCFRVAMVLAQLERLQPLRGPGKPFSFVKLAQSLSLADTRMSFRRNSGDLRKTLSTLADRLLAPEHEDAELLRLPDYVRGREFPRNPPVIAGIPEEDIARRLYIACSRAEIKPAGSTPYTEWWVAYLSDREFRHLPRRKSKNKGESYA